MNRAEEDYLKAILELGAYTDADYVKVSDLSARFGYSEQSVYEMVRKLQDLGHVIYTPYKGVELTPEGTLEAIRLIRAHRIWEVFLTEELGFKWQDVHEEAEQLEHASSEELLKRMYEHLGSPKTCQHGNPIPDFDNHYEIPDYMPLQAATIGARFSITRVVDDYQLLSYLDERGISIGDVLTIESYDALNDNLTVTHQEKTYLLGSTLTAMIYGRLR
jgi:DtxR family transcriptional regulator, Mn-dependent transcriptional regulator